MHEWLQLNIWRSYKQGKIQQQSLMNSLSPWGVGVLYLCSISIESWIVCRKPEDANFKMFLFDLTWNQFSVWRYSWVFISTSLEICEHCIAKQQFSLAFVVVASVTSFEVELESNGRSVLKFISLEKYREDGIVLICELKDEEQVVEGRYSLFWYFTYYLISA